MKPVKNIVYLYSEVMPYAISVMRAMVREFGAEVDCVSWDGERKKTPFVPANEPGITFHKRSGFTKDALIQFIDSKQPPFLYISGRMDKLYLEVATHFKGKLKIVSGCDNQWDGSRKNQIAALLSPWIYKKFFDYFWTPSQRSYEYTRRMGYPKNRILSNMYTGDDAIFPKAYEANQATKKASYPHTITFVGRFAREKGLDVLIAAFVAAKKETNNDWTLTLVGAGTMPMVNEPYITLHDFMMPQQIAAASQHWGVFCLPSIKEPWGVVIHEAAMMGLPIICSDQVGAGDALVISNYNGYVFESGNVAALKKNILDIMQKSDAELWGMGKRSHELSKSQSPTIAAYSLLSILE